MKKRISFKAWIVIGISVSMALVFLVGYSSYKSLQNISKEQVWVNHTEKVISSCEDMLKFVIDAEACQRGFLLTKKEGFLGPYRDAVNQVEKNLTELTKLVTDNPIQVKNTKKLKVLTQHRLKHLAEVLNIKKSEDTANSKLTAELILGKKQMDAVRAQIKKMIAVESVLLIKRTDSSKKSIQQAILIIFGGSALIFIIILTLFKFIEDAFSTQRKAKDKLSVINIDLAKLFKQNKEKTWLISGSTTIDDAMRGAQDVHVRTSSLLTQIAKYVGAEMGVIYLVDEENSETLTKSAVYAYSGTDNNQININEGLVGQVAKEKKRKIWDNIPEDYIKIKSGLGNTKPKHLLIEPVLYQSNVKAVLELAFVQPISPKVLSLLDNINSIIGIGINASQARVKMTNLIRETQHQAEELETQQEELKVTNEELIHQTEMLQASEEELRVQQEELRESNAELEEKARLLSEKNKVIEEAREAIVLKMEELVISGRYKSEFLANMSHELRTPLNSILILARILKDNKTKNLSADEEKYANVIFKAGNDLLQLINDILDLAKIESGKIDLVYENIDIKEVADDLKMLFTELAKSKEINYQFSFDKNLPQEVEIDRFRTEQILKNLLSNAFKFTPKNGEIKVSFSLQNDKNLKIEISDTGIGIPEEKQRLIFEAFQQADGSTSRQFGGTGLGLSISKELAKYMGGEITLSSVVKEGSKFSLIIPLKQDNVIKAEKQAMNPLRDVSLPKQLERRFDSLLEPKPKLNGGTLSLLVVEDDKVFCDFLKEYGEKKGFEVTQIDNGDLAFETAANTQPDAILLDVMLPGIDGWKVLKLLKSDSKTAHIPVHIMSAGDQRSTKAIQSGALSFIKKPIELSALDNIFSQITNTGSVTNYKNILLVEDHQIQSDALAEMFRSKNINVQQAFTGAETLELLKQQSFDCLILDLNLPDISGIDLLEQIKENEDYKHLPVVINTAMELDQEKLNRLLKYSDATVMKSTKSSDRILDEVSLFLHQVKLQENKQKTKTRAISTENLKDKCILLVDDDMRNIFALSAVLDGFGFKVQIANDGEEALVKIEEMEKVDLVLMDIMMPKMDGYETMIEIRKNPKWKKLPIIALTAKAMKEDRDNCINAGANDYITKPVDVDKLLSLIKVWLAG